MDRTLILVKPDAFTRGLTGEIIARFERKGLRIVAMRHMTMDSPTAKQHYAEHEGKPFFGELVDFITSGPLVALVLEGYEAVVAARQVIGATNPLEAAPGSIRGDYALEVGQNMVQGPDATEGAEREPGLFSPAPEKYPSPCQGAWPRGAGGCSYPPAARRSPPRSSASWGSSTRCAPPAPRS